MTDDGDEPPVEVVDSGPAPDVVDVLGGEDPVPDIEVDVEELLLYGPADDVDESEALD